MHTAKTTKTGERCEDCGGSGWLSGFGAPCTSCPAAKDNGKRPGYCTTCGYRAEPGAAQCRLCKIEDDEAAADAAAELALTNAAAERRRRFDVHQAAARAAAGAESMAEWVAKQAGLRG